MKPVFASKTFWLNAITAGIMILALVGQMPEVSAYAAWIALASNILTIILRIYFTVEPVTFQPPADAPKVLGDGGRRIGDHL